MESDNPATPSSARPIDLAVSSSIPLNMEEYQSIEGRAQELLDGWQLAVSTLGGRMEQLLGTIQQGQSIYSDTVDELTQSMSQCLQDTTFMIACCDELDKDFAQQMKNSRQQDLTPSPF
ncbi:hypothetical protein DM01DRAFT_1371089 [Hesseltinella vesiculosa]|uniref:Uncharacterized protein n=1 Tax=Hesseltinella vesiculosa TaxID=101127 RepID=A0A1X2GSN0_9FUNG|nr:hypothetical protein DM01DRAFT_1371089 [Hesseltinella vesiculosa]